MFLLLSSLVLGACSSDDDELAPQQPQSYPLTIEVTENPMVQDGDEGRDNRAAITTTTSPSFNAFKIDYTYGSGYSTGSVDVTNDNGTWTGGSWPVTSEEVTWYAYTGGTFNVNSGNPYINFTVDENAADQHDLLVATASGTYTGPGCKLSFNFDHACAALRFFIKKSTNIDAHTLSITNVVLCNVVKQAKYYYGTGWGNLSSERSVYTLYSGAAVILGSGSYIPMDGGTPDYLFLIPQTLTPWDHTTAIASATTQSYLELTCSIDGGSSQTAYVPFGTSFEKGKKYDVKINIGKNSLYSAPNTKIIND